MRVLFIPKFDPIHEDYEGVLRVLLNADLLLFIGAVCLVLGGESAMIALQYFMYFCFCAARFVWLWAIQPGLNKLVACLVLSLPRLAWSLSSAAFSCCLALWPKKEPYTLVLVPSCSIMMEPAPLDVLPASSPDDSDPFERPFLRPAGRPSAPRSSAGTPAASDVPVVAPSSVAGLVSAGRGSFAGRPASEALVVSAAVLPALPVVCSAEAQPTAPTVKGTSALSAPPPVVCGAFDQPAASVVRGAFAKPASPAAVPAVSKACAGVATAASPAANQDALAVPVAVLPLPAPRTSSGRGVKYILSTSRGENPGHRDLLRAQQKVGKTTPPCALRRAARAALTAGIVKPAPFCLPVAAVAASCLSAGVGSWLASARTVKVARKPARRIVSVRRLLRPAVLVEIQQQKASIVARRRAVAGRRRIVAALLAVFARRASAAAAAPRPVPAFFFGDSAPAAGHAISSGAPGPVWLPAVSPVWRPAAPPVWRSGASAALPVCRPPSAVAPRGHNVGVFAVPAVSSRGGRPPAALSSARGPVSGGAISRPAGCIFPAVPAVAPFFPSPPAHGRPETVTVFAETNAAIARPAVAVYVRPAPKMAGTSRQASGQSQAASSSTSSSLSVSSRRIAVPRPRRRHWGNENEV
ncbi:hypothetical protein [Parasitella parasitica]|uniref:Uncharacterized protein n=1 Tax=Parasitella parasitica TaxID=35722 RepID=A0A0B7NAP0_9FUNG|nr:hypothetical protein [Parasitella parasitica]